MKHCILVKFNSEVTPERKAEMAGDVKALFDRTTEIPGIERADLFTNCIDRANRYDWMIQLTMDPEALPAYDSSLWHRQWKDTYGPLIEKKAIFDYEP